MKLTLEPTEDQQERSPEARFPKVTIACLGDDLDIWQIGDMLEAGLLAWGFHPNTVAGLFHEDENPEESWRRVKDV